MDWLQTITIIGTLGGFMLWMFSKLSQKLQLLHKFIEEDCRRMEGLYQKIIRTLKE